MAQWRIEGTYMETCSCDFLCPCPTSAFGARPTKGDCTFALAYKINRGNYGDVKLDGRSFVIVGYTPSVMGEGDWSVGLIVDDGASSAHVDAISKIATGAEGGPVANLAPLIGKVLGVEQRPIEIHTNGMSNSAKAGELLDQANEGVPGADQNEPMYIDNVGHPSNSRLAMAKGTRSHLHAFGLNWDDVSGKNNGHFAPFNWNGGA
jgi:hypothetical protein